MSNIASSVLRLTNQYQCVFPLNGGQYAYGAFLDIVRAVDPELSQHLHDLNRRKPFTLSPLMGLPRTRGIDRSLPAGWDCWLRVTMLDEALFTTFLEYFRGIVRPEIRLGDAHFLVSEILSTPGSHPWAGYVSLDDLKKRLQEPAPHKFVFKLITPTSFKLKDKDVVVMPTPRLVFGNLASAWRELTGEDKVRAIEKYAEDELRLGNFNLQRKSVLLHNVHELGSVGRVEFTRKNLDDHPTARMMSLLADLAFYSGLGRKTAQGMGMTTRWN